MSDKSYEISKNSTFREKVSWYFAMLFKHK